MVLPLYMQKYMQRVHKSTCKSVHKSTFKSTFRNVPHAWAPTRGAADDGKRAYSAIEVAGQAATPYGRGFGGNQSGVGWMTEFTGGWSLKLGSSSLFLPLFLHSFF